MPAHAISAELKEQALMRLLPPYSWPLRRIADEIGTSPSAIFNWKKEFEAEGSLMPKEKQSQEWSAEQIFTFVLESAMLSEHALAAYCKERGLYVEQVKQWKKSCITANLPDSVKRTQMGKENRVERKRIKQLEKELKRKDKALAETAALLVLREKFNALWEEREEE